MPSTARRTLVALATTTALAGALASKSAAAHTFSFAVPGGPVTVTCTTASYSGTGGSLSHAFTPTFSGCSGGATVTGLGTWTASATSVSGSTYTGTLTWSGNGFRVNYPGAGGCVLFFNTPTGGFGTVASGSLSGSTLTTLGLSLTGLPYSGACGFGTAISGSGASYSSNGPVTL